MYRQSISTNKSEMKNCIYLLFQLGIPVTNAFGASRKAPGQQGLLPVASLPRQPQSQLCAAKLSDLPQGINPFEKSLSKSLDIQADFRDRAKRAVDAAIKADMTKLEIEFPPLLGGDKSKSQYDDFDNIQVK